jgi:hypothetical protein
VRVLTWSPCRRTQLSREGDIRSRADVEAACAGWRWSSNGRRGVERLARRQRVRAVNVVGNRLVLDVCRERGIRAWSNTSTIDVVVTDSGHRLRR